MTHEHSQRTEDRSRRWFLGAAAAMGGLSLVDPVAGGSGGSGGEGYATTTGKSEPRYSKGAAETLYIETEYQNTEGTVETPTMYGEVIRPTDDAGEAITDIPVILTYSPYNDVRSPQGEAGSIADDGVADYFVPRGYARATFDVVGTRNSGGCYDYGGVRERKTGAQIVDHLGSREWSNGKVGMIGGSYDGTTQLAAAVEDPEHLAAIVPQVAIDRWYDYAFGGGIRYFLNNEYPTDEGFDTPLAFDFGFGLLPPANVTEPGKLADTLEKRFTPCDAVEHTERAYAFDPVYDDFWTERDYRRRAENVSAAVFIEGGWLDHNVKHWDSTRFYRALPDDHPKRLVMGQWNHSASQFPDAQDIRHAWFDYWLKGLETGVMDLPPVDTQLNTGERVQQRKWPPQGTEDVSLRLVRESDRVDELALAGTNIPVYTDNEPPLTEEELFATGASTRGNFLKFVSKPVAEDVRIAGSPLLDLLAASTDDSTQYTPVLYDRAPDGTVEIITRGFLNARNRDGLDVSKPVPTDGTYRAPVELWDVDWLLPTGHRLGIAVASDNADWALDDPDGASTNELVLGEGGTILRVPVSRGAAALRAGPPLSVEGRRSDDGSVFTAGQTNQVDVTVSDLSHDATVRDAVPAEWTVLDTGDVERVEQAGDRQYVSLGTVTPGETEATRTYFIEAPDSTGQYEFGPAEARPVGIDRWIAFGDAETNAVAGQRT